MTLHKVRLITLAAAVGALVLVAIAGPGSRWEWWPWQVGIAMLRIATYAALAIAVVAAGLVAMLAMPRWRARPWLPILALCIAMAAAAPPMILAGRAKELPPIHDITTDTADPPAFVALAPQRKESPNGLGYGGPEVARMQREAYPDIEPLILDQPPRQAHQRAIDVARAMGWRMAASDAAAGRIEATATTRWFGFQDDIVVRIRPQGEGSRVDVRSVSRVGRGDLGANAARIREFLRRLA